MDEWDDIEEKAKIACLGDIDAMVEDDERDKSLQDGIKSAVEEKARQDGRWKIR